MNQLPPPLSALWFHSTSIKPPFQLFWGFASDSKNNEKKKGKHLVAMVSHHSNCPKIKKEQNFLWLHSIQTSEGIIVQKRNASTKKMINESLQKERIGTNQAGIPILI